MHLRDKQEESVLTQGSDGVVTLSGIEHLSKHVWNANAVAEHVAVDLDFALSWSRPPNMDRVGMRTDVERRRTTGYHRLC